MEEKGGQIVTPVVSYHNMVGRLCDSNPAISKKKRDHHFDSSNPAPQKAAETWNANDWVWDSARFIAKPSLQCSEAMEKTSRGVSDQNPAREGSKSRNPEEDAAVGSGETVPKRVKKLKPVSPGHLACQVDDCIEDLSVGKDYHKRHRVCEIHSKASEALVGKQPQRFCQQCSRFHPLEEFDEGKRSCRRRLDGHNRRRRKGHLEVIPQNYEQNSGDSNIVNLLVALSRVQQNGRDTNISPPDNNRLFEIISNANPSFPGTKLQGGSVPDQMPIYQNVPPDQPTKDLLAVLSTTPGTPSSEKQSPQGSAEESNSEKSKSSSGNVATCLNLNGGGQQMKELPLKLSGISSENRVSKREATYWHFGSYCSNILLERKLPSPLKPVTHDFFAMQSSREKLRDGGDQGAAPNDKVNSSNSCSTSLRLFGSENASFLRSSPEHIEQASTSGSNHSLSSLNSDSQDRTGRIMFKLFDKDPSHLPVSLRTQINNWLLHSPSDMESYIRPGCMVLAIYISMPAFSWDHLEENLLSYVKSLVVDIDVGFWGSDRFLVHTDRQMASFCGGKLRLCRNWMAPELISISPLAVVRGRETSLVLKGKRLLSPGAKIHCTHAVGYSVMKSPASCEDSEIDEIILSTFKVDGAASDDAFGRCYIEVECGLKSASFPVIVADEAICNELRLLELHIETGFELDDCFTREWILHFLNELGWLFQRRRDRFSSEIRSYSLDRLKFLLIFSVDHGFCSLVETLLNILQELDLFGAGGSLAMEMLSESRLLNRAVTRRYRNMVAMLVCYSIIEGGDGSERFVFAANVVGPGGLTPLHLVACMSDADDVVDALTSDPLELGLSSWSSVLDANGFSPYAYAAKNGNHSYNSLVDRKISERKGDGEEREVSISIGNDDDSEQQKKKKSCSRCHAVRYGSILRSLFHRPFVVAVATVCFCVCVVMRGHPGVRDRSPFLWENLDFGST